MNKPIMQTVIEDELERSICHLNILLKGMTDENKVRYLELIQIRLDNIKYILKCPNIENGCEELIKECEEVLKWKST
jgi:hypothetical protein